MCCPDPPKSRLQALKRPHDPRYLTALSVPGDQVHVSRSGAERELEPSRSGGGRGAGGDSWGALPF